MANAKPHTDDTPPLDAESTEHLKTAPDSEMVIGTSRIDTTPPKHEDDSRTDKFRRDSMGQVATDTLPKVG